MSNPGLKAGLIGAGVAILLVLLGLIPCLGCVTALLAVVLYACVGALAAYWLEPPRTPAEGAKVGVIAALISSLAYGVFNTVSSVIYFQVLGGRGAIMRQIPPEAMRQLRDVGIDPRVFVSTGGVLGVSTVCCALGLMLGAALGAAGGAIMASAKSD